MLENVGYEEGGASYAEERRVTCGEKVRRIWEEGVSYVERRHV